MTLFASTNGFHFWGFKAFRRAYDKYEERTNTLLIRLAILLAVKFFGNIRVIGISKEKETKPRLTTKQKRRETCILLLLLLFSLLFLYLLILNPLFAVLWGFFSLLFIVFMALPQDQVPKDLERIRRDIDRRTHFPGGMYGKGLLHFENGGPTPAKKTDEDY